MNPRGMTLLEVLLAMAIAVVLALGIYESLVIHYAQADGGREKVARAQMIRGVAGQIQKDVRNVFTGWRPVSTEANQQSDGSDEPVSEDEDDSEGSTSASSSSSSSSSSASGSGQISEYEVPQGGVLGFADAVTLITRRTPAGLDFRPSVVAEDARPPVSDLRLIRYWFGSPGTEGAEDRTGLVRQEIDYIPDVTAGDDPMSGARTQLIAEEVRSIALRYFDGFGWVTEWSQTREKTPQAIEIVLGMAKPTMNPTQNTTGTLPQEELEYIRIVAGSQDLPPPSEEDAAAASGSSSSSSDSSSSPPPSAPAPSQGDNR